MPGITYPTKEEIIHSNRVITSKYSQNHVVQQEANLDFVLDSMERYAEDIGDTREKILKKAAFLIYNLSYKAHAFLDGNKRTSITATLLFLEKNGLRLNNEDELGQEELAKIVKEAASGKKSVNYLYTWLKKRLFEER